MLTCESVKVHHCEEKSCDPGVEKIFFFLGPWTQNQKKFCQPMFLIFGNVHIGIRNKNITLPSSGLELDIK